MGCALATFGLGALFVAEKTQRQKKAHLSTAHLVRPPWLPAFRKVGRLGAPAREGQV